MKGTCSKGYNKAIKSGKNGEGVLWRGPGRAFGDPGALEGWGGHMGA